MNTHQSNASNKASNGFLSRVPLKHKKRKPERHGMSQHELYQTWIGMKNRCHNPTVHAYRFYGARGVRVCFSWRYSFLQFYLDMGERPSPLHQLDRIDNSLGYFPGNVRWSAVRGRPRKKVPLKTIH